MGVLIFLILIFVFAFFLGFGLSGKGHQEELKKKEVILKDQKNKLDEVAKRRNT